MRPSSDGPVFNNLSAWKASCRRASSAADAARFARRTTSAFPCRTPDEFSSIHSRKEKQPSTPLPGWRASEAPR